jgi:tryptophan-rich sensory protein
MMALTSAAIGLLIRVQSFQGWYEALNKPWFAPTENMLIASWILIHIFLGVTAYILWHDEYDKTAPNPEAKHLLGLLPLQLILSFGWTALFFGLELPLWAFVDRVITLLLLFYIFRHSLKVSKFVSTYYIVYIFWVLYQMTFNLSIIFLNK